MKREREREREKGEILISRSMEKQGIYTPRNWQTKLSKKAVKQTKAGKAPRLPANIYQLLERYNTPK